MIKEWLNRAADRSFRLVAALLMRRAVAPLMRIDEASLREVGLTRAAVADFLAMPLGTDPGQFFTQRRERNGRAAAPEQRLDSQRDARDGPKRRNRRKSPSKPKLSLAKEIP